MSNTPENMFKKPKPMFQPVKLSNIPGRPTMPAHIQSSRPSGPNMPNLQSFQNKLSNGQHPIEHLILDNYLFYHLKLLIHMPHTSTRS